MKIRGLFLLLILACGARAAMAQSPGAGPGLSVALPHRWHLILEDRAACRAPTFDDHHAPMLWIPSQLPQEGYLLKTGVVWFRVHFDVPDACVGKPMHLVLGKIDVCDETWLNGNEVGHMGAFPPKVETAWCETRFYSVPAGLLKKHNVLAVRVLCGGVLGGITDGPIGLYDDAAFANNFQFHGARPTFDRIVTSNGRATAVYDANLDMVRYVLPEVFQSYREGKMVDACLRHLRNVHRERVRSVGYVACTHIVRVDYGTVQVLYFAPFTLPRGIFCAVVSGPQARTWKFVYDRAQTPFTVQRVDAHGQQFYFFGLDGTPLREVVPIARRGTLVADEIAYMHAVQARAHLPRGLSPAERAVALQSITVLKMAQVPPQPKWPDAGGQIVACLPPGSWNVTWLRDGYYSTMALVRLGLFDEARRMLTFELRAHTNRFEHYKKKDGTDVGVGVPYLPTVCRYFGDGSEESFSDGEGPNIELDGFGLFLTAFSRYVTQSGDTRMYMRWIKTVQTRVADALLHNIASNGLVRAESGPWERYLQFKQFTYTSVAVARGLHDFAALLAAHHQPSERYSQAADRMAHAISTTLSLGDGWLKGNVEATRPDAYDSHDGGTFEAYAMGVLTDPSRFQRQYAEYARVLELGDARRGFSRIDKGDSYETAEWVLLDLRVASSAALMGEPRVARHLLDWVTQQAARNYNLVPEMYRRDNGAYDGAIPMVGFGAGAYLLTVLDVHSGR